MAIRLLRWQSGLHPDPCARSMPGMSDDRRSEPEVLIPEVLPPQRDPFPPPPGARRKDTTGRAKRAFGPIIAGAIIDGVDWVTVGPMGLVIGFVAAFWALGVVGVRLPQRLLLSLAAGLYCLMPMGRRLPVATIIGGIAQFLERR
jgi:hypothetical protein